MTRCYELGQHLGQDYRTEPPVTWHVYQGEDMRLCAQCLIYSDPLFRNGADWYYLDRDTKRVTASAEMLERIRTSLPVEHLEYLPIWPEQAELADRLPAPVHPLAHAADVDPPLCLAEVVDVYRRWLYLPDADVVVAALGAVAGNLLAGDPLWLLIVGAGGSGKTETISPLAGLDYVHPAATITEAALLSGTSKKEKEAGATGGLLCQIGNFGIILAKDFSGVLSMHREARAQSLAALREVFDGSWSRPVGTAGGRVLKWSGKAGLVGAVTPSIDRHSAVLGALGERFVLYRLAVDDPTQQGLRRLRNRGKEKTMRAELADAVAGILAGVDVDSPPRPLTDEEEHRLVALAAFVVHARSAVERDGYSGEVVVMPSVEAPGRLVGSLGALLAGVEAVGADAATAWRITEKIGWDCVPDMRRRLLLAMHGRTPQRRAELVTATGIPNTTCARTLEDLALLGLVDQTKAGAGDTAAWCYTLSRTAVTAWPTSPETSDKEYTLSSRSPNSDDDTSGEATEARMGNDDPATSHDDEDQA